ncbi:MAG: hypothetical protein MMC33_002833 [Icmadophila ericetorum]|nr:hypothetical protein [Icmadophila ericetorum]
MLFPNTVFPLICLLGQARSQSSTVPYVPTGTPVAGDYSGPLRPQIHFSPPQFFMNDPNGMFLDAEGTYHLYYQYDPIANIADNQHWGHATSTDLYRWTNQPIAIFPDSPNDGIFTGSAVIDINNTSGFFPNQTNGVVAIYTLNTPTEQTQEIAYSLDNGFTFTKYSGNPVISINSDQFRDPKVIWYEPTQSWVMAVGYNEEYIIAIYTSPNLRDWTHASNFTHGGLLGLAYECPNLIPIPMLQNASAPDPFSSSNFVSPGNPTEQVYVLIISINPGAPVGGSITQYFPGTFNGTHFAPVDNAARIADFAKDNYAGQFFYNIPLNKPAISMAWASNWEYAQQVPTGQLENFRSAQSLPRMNALANVSRMGYDLLSFPVSMSHLYTTPPTQPLTSNPSLGNSSLSLSYGTSVPSGSLLFNITVSNLPSASNTTGTINATFLSSSDPLQPATISTGVFLGGNPPVIWLHRSPFSSALNFASSNPFFTDKFSTTGFIQNGADGNYGNLAGGSFSLLGVIDRTIFEVFVNNGQASGTMIFFPDAPLDTLVISSGGLNEGVVVDVEVRGLESGWAGQEDGNGIVVGNVTTPSQKMSRDGWMGEDW